LQVELVQVPQLEPASALAPKVSAAAAVSLMLIIGIMCYSRSEKRVAGVNVVPDKTNESDVSWSTKRREGMRNAPRIGCTELDGRE
jgi:hypothetical protein